MKQERDATHTKNSGRRKFDNLFKSFTSYDVENFTTYSSFTNWLHRPTDAAALAVFRVLFGIAMLLDIPEEREGSHIDVKFGDPKVCHFPLINSIRPLSLPCMGVVYMVMWLGAAGIALGFKFRISCLCFSLPYWYIFLLDKPAWNNHSYLYGLCGLLLFFTEANKCWSIDSWTLKHPADQSIPYWNYFLIKFQFFILYFYAGLKKLTIEWLSGYAMTNLGYHWLFLPLRYVLSVELIELLLIHWTTAIFDVTIAFWMTWRRSRLWATPFMLAFHLMNSRLFSIGMFPWVCLAEVHLFFAPDWPRQCAAKLENFWNRNRNGENEKSPGIDPPNSTPKTGKEAEIKGKRTSKKTKKLVVPCILVYCLLQLFIPYSHFITKGYNNWTNGLYGYSWDMMVHSYDTISVSIKVQDNKNNESHFLNPYAFSQYDRWTKHADMAFQYAKCIQRNLLNDQLVNPSPILKSRNFSIYFDIWCSMNGRFQQRVYDPQQDLLKASWHPLRQTEWVLPLLHELNFMRPKLNEITKNVLQWSNYSDVLFIADFPGLSLHNYIAPELFNVTLSVIDGDVQLFTDETSAATSLSTGDDLKIGPGHHRVLTKGYKPSTYMYTFVNRTMMNLNEVGDARQGSEEKWFPIWDEFMARLENYKDFLYHVGNSLLFLGYGVPMPIRIRA